MEFSRFPRGSQGASPLKVEVTAFRAPIVSRIDFIDFSQMKIRLRWTPHPQLIHWHVLHKAKVQNLSHYKTSGVMVLFQAWTITSIMHLIPIMPLLKTWTTVLLG